MDDIKLWAGLAPGSEDWTHSEQETVLPGPPAMRFLRNVVAPVLLPFHPSKPAASGAAMIVCPGGAFHLLGIQHEGLDAARWLADHGIAAFVLKYRLVPTPSRGDEALALVGQLMHGSSAEQAERLAVVNRYAPLAFADGARAVRTVRQQASEHNISPDRVGILGFSAGGRVALETATHEDLKHRPNFVAAVSPAICEQSTVAADAPPLFLVSANDDPFVQDSHRAHQAWRNAQVPVELHAYQRGGHGYGMNKQRLPIDYWPERMLEWLRSQDIV